MAVPNAVIEPAILPVVAFTLDVKLPNPVNEVLILPVCVFTLDVNEPNIANELSKLELNADTPGDNGKSSGLVIVISPASVTFPDELILKLAEFISTFPEV